LIYPLIALCDTGWWAALRLSLGPTNATPLLGLSGSCTHAPLLRWLGFKAAIDISLLAVKWDVEMILHKRRFTSPCQQPLDMAMRIDGEGKG
jgi:hypothetical protein